MIPAQVVRKLLRGSLYAPTKHTLVYRFHDTPADKNPASRLERCESFEMTRFAIRTGRCLITTAAASSWRAFALCCAWWFRAWGRAVCGSARSIAARTAEKSPALRRG